MFVSLSVLSCLNKIGHYQYAVSVCMSAHIQGWLMSCRMFIILGQSRGSVGTDRTSLSSQVIMLPFILHLSVHRCLHSSQKRNTPLHTPSTICLRSFVYNCVIIGLIVWHSELSSIGHDREMMNLFFCMVLPLGVHVRPLSWCVYIFARIVQHGSGERWL